jgi:hypothetical protein
VAAIEDDTTATVLSASALCVLEALGARTPGLYRHFKTTNSARAFDSTEHLLLVHSDGSVTHTSKRTLDETPDTGSDGITYTDAERCELAEEAYFAACASSLDASSSSVELDSDAWTCLYVEFPNDWLVNCQDTEVDCGG